MIQAAIVFFFLRWKGKRFSKGDTPTSSPPSSCNLLTKGAVAHPISQELPQSIRAGDDLRNSCSSQEEGSISVGSHCSLHCRCSQGSKQKNMVTHNKVINLKKIPNTRAFSPSPTYSTHYIQWGHSPTMKQRVCLTSCRNSKQYFDLRNGMAVCLCLPLLNSLLLFTFITTAWCRCTYTATNLCIHGGCLVKPVFYF